MRSREVLQAISRESEKESPSFLTIKKLIIGCILLQFVGVLQTTSAVQTPQKTQESGRTPEVKHSPEVQKLFTLFERLNHFVHTVHPKEENLRTYITTPTGQIVAVSIQGNLEKKSRRIVNVYPSNEFFYKHESPEGILQISPSQWSEQLLGNTDYYEFLKQTMLMNHSNPEYEAEMRYFEHQNFLDYVLKDEGYAYGGEREYQNTQNNTLYMQERTAQRTEKDTQIFYDENMYRDLSAIQSSFGLPLDSSSQQKMLVIMRSLVTQLEEQHLYTPTEWDSLNEYKISLEKQQRSYHLSALVK